MKRKELWIRWMAAAILFAAVVGGTYAATPEQIDQAIVDGVAWLAAKQNGFDGSWGDYEQAAQTCLALVKLEERAHDLGYSPFDPEYEFSDQVVFGWQYLFGVPHVNMHSPLSVQVHGANNDDPDFNGNGYGLFFATWGSHPTYTTGICLMALAASGAPDRPNDGGLDFDGNGNPDTFLEIAQDAGEWLAFAQGDLDWCEGGWIYDFTDNGCWGADQSNAGYATLGLAYAEEFGCTVPAWVHTELDIWIAYIQCADGGSGYSGCEGSNLLRTGNLIFQMCYNEYDQDGAQFQNALGYIEGTWLQWNIEPGWGYGQWPSSYQAMYCLMKGLEYCGIDMIDYNADGVLEDWFNQEPPAAPPEDFASTLVQQQNGDGSWPGCDWGSDVLCTSWALLILEKVAPPPPNEPPDCGPAYPSQDTLWPPNHKWVSVDVLGVTDPDGDPVTITIDGIYQDEPVDTYGDGRFTPDGQGVGTPTAHVRAERAGTKKVPGNGRFYHIYFTADDGQGGACTGEVLVAVPHDQKRAPIDDGPLYDSTALLP